VEAETLNLDRSADSYANIFHT